MREKRKIPLFLCGCMALLLIGSSFAFWSGKIDHTNDLKAHQTDAKIEEIFKQGSRPSGTVKKEVAFKNNSTNAAFLRVAYAETWKKKSGDDWILLNNQVNETDVAAKHWKNGFGANSDLWQDGGDGWFYYKKVLEPGETTANILESITFSEYSGAYSEYENAEYQLYFRMELLQVSDSASTLNREEVNRKASSTVFGKEAVVSGKNVSWS